MGSIIQCLGFMDFALFFHSAQCASSRLLRPTALRAYYLKISAFRFLNSSREIVPAFRRDFNFSYSASFLVFQCKPIPKAQHQKPLHPVFQLGCTHDLSSHTENPNRSFLLPPYYSNFSVDRRSGFIAHVHFLLPNAKLSGGALRSPLERWVSGVTAPAEGVAKKHA